MKKIIKGGSVKKKLKALIYGEPGSGKTTFAVGHGKVLVLNYEAGLGDAVVDNIECERVQDALDVFNAIKLGKIEYDTIVLDSITSMARKERLAANPLNMNDRGKLKKTMNSLLEAVESCKINVIVTALEVLQNLDDVDDATGSVSTTIKKFIPAVEGYKTDFTGIFDIVAYFYKDYDKAGKLIYLFDVEGRKYNYAKHRYAAINNSTPRELKSRIEAIQSSEAHKGIQSEVGSVESTTTGRREIATQKNMDMLKAEKIAGFLESNPNKDGLDKVISNIATAESMDSEEKQLCIDYANSIYALYTNIV